MAKVNDSQGQILDKLQSMIMKKAEEARASGVPGKDTNYQSVSKDTDKVDKETAGSPEKHTQGYKQDASTDGSKPVASEKPALTNAPGQHPPEGTKSASELGREILAMINSKKAEDEAAEKVAKETETTKVTFAQAEAKMAEDKAAAIASGVPGKDTHYTSVSKGTDHVNKEQAGSPEKHTQGYKQKPAKDCCEPAASEKESLTDAPGQHPPGKSKKGEDEYAQSQAYEVGRALAVEMLKRASTQTSDMQKEAGRRDFEQLIAEAAAKIEEEAQAEKVGADLFDELYAQEKQAESAGSDAFYSLFKQAQYEYTINKLAADREELATCLVAETTKNEKIAKEAELNKTAAVKAETELSKRAEEEKENQKMANMVALLRSEVINGLKHEILQANRE